VHLLATVKHLYQDARCNDKGEGYEIYEQ